MVRYTLRSLISHGRRASLTALAVVLGVSMITGTLVFTDTIKRSFDDLFHSSAQGATVIVSGRQDIASLDSTPADLPSSLVHTISHLTGVAAAAGEVSQSATIVGVNGKVLRTTGLPTLALSYMPAPFTGLRFASGAPPTGPHEVAIDSSAATREGFHVGDTATILTAQPAKTFRITGIVKLGSGTLGAATVAVFDLRTAQQLYSKPGRVDRIYVAAQPKVATRFLLSEISPLLSPQFVARTNAAQTSASARLITDQLGVLTGGLLAFGFVAVLVGAFVIFNTFSITVAQRVREFSVLRALGALRRQLLLAVLAEATIIGAIGAGIGLGAGLLAALLIHAVFNAVGLDLPSTGLVLRGRTVGIGLGVGVLVTIVAGILPAVRATQAPPLESLREGLAPTMWRYAWLLRLVAAVALAVTGVALILGGRGTLDHHLERGGVGALCLILGVLVLGPLIVRVLARVVSWPVERAGGIVPVLARENATRNPARTAVSASSLIIGLALVLFVMIYASGLRDSAHRIIDRTFVGDLTIQSQDGQSPIPAAATQAVTDVPGLLAVSSLKTAPGHLRGAGNIDVQGIDPTTIGQVYRFDWIHGSAATLAALQPGQALLEEDTARAAHLKLGARIRLITDSGVRLPLTVTGIYSDRALLTGIAISRAQFDQSFDQPAAPGRVHQARAGRERRRRAVGGGPSSERIPGRRRALRTPARRPGRRTRRYDPDPAVRAAGAERGDGAAGDRQHAQPFGLRAHARARHAPRDGHDRPSGADPDPQREPDHGRDRIDRWRRARRLPGVGRDPFRARRGHRLLAAVAAGARRLRRRARLRRRRRATAGAPSFAPRCLGCHRP